jgi:hypothetical protein
VASGITDFLAVMVLTAKLMTDLLAGTSTVDFLTENGVTAMSVIDSLTGMVTMATSVAAMVLNDDVDEVSSGGNVADYDAHDGFKNQGDGDVLFFPSECITCQFQTLVSLALF